MRLWAWGRCHPHGSLPGGNSAGAGTAQCGHAGDGDAVVWALLQQQEALGFASPCIKYASGQCIS